MGGAEKTADPEKIKGAEEAVRVVTEHAKQLPIASPTEVTASAKRALDAILDIVGHGGTVEDTLKDPRVSSHRELIHPTDPKKYAQLEDITSGHFAPPLVMDKKSAKKHSEILTVEAELRIERKIDHSKSSEESFGEKGFFEKLWDGIKKVGKAITDATEAISDFFERINSAITDTLSSVFITRPIPKAEQQVSSWLDASYLGEKIASRFKKTPPVITAEPESFFRKREEAYGSPSVGIYFTDTNHIAVLDRFNTRRNHDDAFSVVAHEDLHYAAYLGGGFNIRFIDSEGKYHSGTYIKPLHEGLTELHAQELVRSHDMTPSYVAYAPEVLSASFLQHLVGKEVLKEAYLTGNFTEVAKLVDEKLGKGTFNEFMAKLESKPLDALLFLQNKASAAKVDILTWAENPIVRQAKKNLGVLE
ncbi:MAG: hypothetical protein ABID61_03150 [Candidatus Micrarchaeota archaeon]